MGSFIFVSYSGSDAGAVLLNILNEENSEVEVHEIESDVEVARQPVGFQPNPEEPEEDDDEDDPEH